MEIKSAAINIAKTMAPWIAGALMIVGVSVVMTLRAETSRAQKSRGRK